MQETITTEDGKQLHGYDWSLAEPSPTVALIHGYGEYAGRYEHLANYFNDRGIGMVTADLRGHGRSEGRRGYVRHFENYHYDVDAIVKYAGEKSQGRELVLMAHSMGGLVACDWLLATDDPNICGMVLTSPFLGIKKRVHPLVLRLIRCIAKYTGQLSIPSVLKGREVCRDPVIAKAYDTDPLINRKGNIHWFGEALAAMDRVHGDVQRFQTPLLLLYAGEDLLASLQVTNQFATALTMPDKTTELLAGLYHEILNEPLETRNRLMQRISEWIHQRSGQGE